MDTSRFVRLWFIREKMGDFIITIHHVAGTIYSIDVDERDKRDPYKSSFTFGTYESMAQYIDIVTQQVLTDYDLDHPFTHFQYSIPCMPTITFPLYHMMYEPIYENFASAIDYHFS